MKKTPFNPQVDDYIANAAKFAQPVARHLRALLHKTCPDVVEEIKWGIPHFDYRGQMMCIFAAHTRHCAFTFWKESLMSDARLRGNPDLKANKRFLGQIKSEADLPPDDQLVAFIQEAMALNEQGTRLAPRQPKTPRDIEVPDYFAEQLAAHPQAKEVFDSKPASFRREYLVWITEAKTEATRQKRVQEALEWIAEGKGRFWKYK